MPDDGTTLLLTASDVRASLDWDPVMETLARTFRDHVARRTLASVAEQIPLQDGAVHLKAGGLRTPEIITTKSNVRPRGRRAFGAIVLLDPARTAPVAILDSGYLTAFRTAAVGVLGAIALGAGDGMSVALIGAGPIARQVLRATSHAGIVGELNVWSRTMSRARELASLESDRLAVTVHEHAAQAAGAADLVITCTPARRPLIAASDLRADAIVVALGSDEPGKQELDLGGASVFVVADDVSGARLVGECQQLPADAGVIGLGEIVAEVVLPPADGRRLLDSVGTGFVDTAVAQLAVSEARAQGLGRRFDLAA